MTTTYRRCVCTWSLNGNPIVMSGECGHGFINLHRINMVINLFYGKATLLAREQDLGNRNILQFDTCHSISDSWQRELKKIAALIGLRFVWFLFLNYARLLQNGDRFRGNQNESNNHLLPKYYSST